MFFLCYLFYFFLFFFFFFFFNDTATTEIYTLSLHDALPILSIFQICKFLLIIHMTFFEDCTIFCELDEKDHKDRKSTRLNSSHITISYAVFCLKKKKKKKKKKIIIITNK